MSGRSAAQFAQSFFGSFWNRKVELSSQVLPSLSLLSGFEEDAEPGTRIEESLLQSGGKNEERLRLRLRAETSLVSAAKVNRLLVAVSFDAFNNLRSTNSSAEGLLGIAYTATSGRRMAINDKIVTAIVWARCAVFGIIEG